jgi:hypothetical protein
VGHGLGYALHGWRERAFCGTVSGFLGATTAIFPSFLGLQPRLTIGETLGDLYDLRNIIAHGRQIPAKPFLEKFDIVDAGGTRIDGIELSYAQILTESALFLIVKSLRKIMVNVLVDLVRDEANWKRTMKIGARLEQARSEANRV